MSEQLKQLINDYCQINSLSLPALAKRMGISPAAIYARMKQETWSDRVILSVETFLVTQKFIKVVETKKTYKRVIKKGV